MAKNFLSLVLAIFMCLPITISAEAASEAKATINWLSTSGVPCEYNESLGWLTLNDDKLGYRIIDRATGKRVQQYDFISDFSLEGYAIVGKYTPDGIKFGCVDKEMKTVVPLAYDEVRSNFHASTRKSTIFEDGLAIVSREGTDGATKFGAVTTAGKVAVPLEYDYLSNFSNGFAIAGNRDADGSWKFGCLGKTGKVVIPLEYDAFKDISTAKDLLIDGAICAKKDEKWGCLDKDGKVIIPLEYTDINGFADGRIVTEKWPESGRSFYTVYDNTGKVIIPEGRYDDISGYYSDGLVCVGKKNANGDMKYGYADTNGKIVIPLEYDDASYCFENGLSAVAKQNADGRKNWSYIDKTGKVTLKLNGNYRSVSLFEDGYAQVSDGWKYGYIDKTGKVVVPLKYTGGSYGFSDSGFASVFLNGKEGAVNTSGVEVVPPEYDTVFTPSKSYDVIEVWEKSSDSNIKKGCYDQSGKLVIPVEYDSIGRLYTLDGKDQLVVFAAKNGALPGTKKAGLFDGKGRVILPVEYEEISFIGNLGYVKSGDIYTGNYRYGIFEWPKG